MLIERMRKRLAADTKFIEPCLPSPPPSGSNWIYEIKHDGSRPGVRLNEHLAHNCRTVFSEAPLEP